MAKLDEVKEILTTLRVWLSLTIGLIAVLVSGLVKRFDSGKIDWIFYSGSFLFFILILVAFLIMLKIAQKTKIIREL